MTDQRDRRDLMQRLNNSSWRAFEDDEQARILGEMNKKRRWTDQPPDKYDWYIVIFLLGIVGLIFYGSSFVLADKGELDCSKCHSAELVKKQKMVAYFQKKGSPDAERMAEAVIGAKRTRLMAAIAVVETKGDPSKRNTGYKQRHDGAFQVNPKHWGEVPKDAAAQTRQTQAILDELIDAKKGNIRTALNAYGGDTVKRTYARDILKELSEVPQ